MVKMAITGLSGIPGRLTSASRSVCRRLKNTRWSSIASTTPRNRPRGRILTPRIAELIREPRRTEHPSLLSAIHLKYESEMLEPVLLARR